MKNAQGYVSLDDGLKLFYETHGEGAENVLVPLTWYAESFGPLAEGRTITYFDWRNRGRSDAVSDPAQLGLDLDIADLEAVRQRLGYGRFSLIGHSYNTAPVALYAAAHPERVSRLVLIGPITVRRKPYWPETFAIEGFLNPPDVPTVAEMRRTGADKSDPVAFARTWYRDVLLPVQVADRASIEKIPLSICEQPNEWPDHFVPAFFNGILNSMGDWDFRPRLTTLNMPTLVVAGSGERLEGIREWTTAAPNARLLVVPGSGHYPFIENPEVFFPAVEQFLAGTWPAAAEAM